MGFKDLIWQGDQSQQKDPQFLGLQKTAKNVIVVKPYWRKILKIDETH